LDDVRKATIQIESQGTFIDPQVGLQVNAAGRGSGFIIDPSGIAVTNNHVVAGSALIKVWVGGEATPRNARVLGLSECSDLAVIDIEGDGFPYLNWYQGQVKTGLDVYSAGFPLGEPEFSLTKGIISKEAADGQSNWASLSHVLGHDATINPGNSGGPLVDSNGQVVGVNYSSRPDFNQYFAIGSDIAVPVVDELRSGKDVDSIGVNGTAVLSDDGSLSGIWVSSVKSGSSADKAGVQGGDILYQLEGLVLATDGTMKDYCDVIRSHKPADALTISVIRYATGELLKGQLNGPTLAVTGTFDTTGASSTPSAGSGELTTFTDKNNLFVIDIPSDWTYAQSTGDSIYFDTFKSPDELALVESIVYDDTSGYAAALKGKYALYLLNTNYSSTGQEGDIRISDDSMQKDGSERLVWTSKGGGYSGISFLENRGSTFLFFTVEWSNSAKDQYIDTLNAVITSYRAP
jgi:serine protease Do